MRRGIRSVVRARARQRCEYCRLHEDDLPFIWFHLEHILPRKHGGIDDLRQLAWSCHYCNLSKSSNLSGRDPETGRIVVLFNPRRQRWSRHFAWVGPRLVGLTVRGRATIACLNMNATHRIELRASLIEAGRFPPD
jgi:hypothetical protein